MACLHFRSFRRPRETSCLCCEAVDVAACVEWLIMETSFLRRFRSGCVAVSLTNSRALASKWMTVKASKSCIQHIVCHLHGILQGAAYSKLCRKRLR